MTLEESVAHVLKIALKRGVKIHKPDQVLDLSEPPTGSEAHGMISDLVDETGTFRTINGIYEEDLIEMAGLEDDDEEIADSLTEDSYTVYEAPPDYQGETVKFLCFFYQPKSDEET